MSPLMAHSGHREAAPQCPLLGVNRTSGIDACMSAYGLKRMFASRPRRGKLIFVLCGEVAFADAILEAVKTGEASRQALSAR
jgi:hypothetical protein